MKKLLCVFLACLMVVGLLAGCGDGGSGATTSSGAATSGGSSSSGGTTSGAVSDGNTTTTAYGTYSADKPYELTFAWVQLYPQDATAAQAVYDAINEYMIPNYHIKVDFLPLEYASYQQTLQLMFSGGDPLDVMPVYYTNASSWIGMNAIVDMNPYLATEDGAKVIEALGGEANAKVGTMNGVLFGFPANKESVELGGLCMRADICDELGITEKYGLADGKDAYDGTVYSWDVAEEIFDTVLAAYPNMVPCYMMGSQSVMRRFAFFDELADQFGVLDWESDRNSTTVVNEFETEAYREAVTRMGRWMDKGYIFKDAATDTTGNATMIKAGNTFSYPTAIKPGHLSEANAQCGQRMYDMYFEDQVEGGYSTTNVSFFDTGIATNSADPDMAFKFISAMYSDPTFYNLWQYGIEGVNYQVLDDGTAYWPEGQDDSNYTYHQNCGWELGNQFQSYVWQSYGADGTPLKDANYWDTLQHHNDWAMYSPAYGFMWDSSAYQTQSAALQNALNTYRPALETGTGGEAAVEANLKALNDALYAAGLQEVMDAKQAQLDAWLAANGPTQTPQANLDTINSVK